MCRTPYCFGDCDECVAEDAYNKGIEDAAAECPHKDECKIVTLDIKTDKCMTHGTIFNY